MQKPQPAIELIGISKKYEIHHEKPTLVEAFVKGRNETFWALKDINVTIQKGETVGIIGRNGSGKTTLLKIIAGITTPTTGSVRTSGKIVSLIDLEAGFHPDLTGVQNIFLNGLLLGIKRDDIVKNLRKIISYADIRQFIDIPLFTYSAGMKLRLGFSIAVHSNPDILLLDEGLSFGDENFTAKARQTLASKTFRNKTIVMVYHSPKLLLQQCPRALIVNSGSIAFDGRMTINIYKKRIDPIDANPAQG